MTASSTHDTTECIKLAISDALPVEDGHTFSDIATALSAGRDMSQICWKFLEQELAALLSQHSYVRYTIGQVKAGISLLADSQRFLDADIEAKAASYVLTSIGSKLAPSSQRALKGAYWAAIAAYTAETDPTRCTPAITSALYDLRHAKADACTRIAVDSEAKSQALRWIALLLASPGA